MTGVQTCALPISAIDVEASISRVMVDVASPEQVADARAFKQLYATYQQNQDLINVGAYRKGSDPNIDKAVVKYPLLNRYLSQNITESFTVETSIDQLSKVLAP